ncbi:peptide deformylase [Saezia sanguinis]|uniref:peptide deformylase n=1 Tax=Saezia sanguinis TaxID=1965230 RepID=UPI0030548A21
MKLEILCYPDARLNKIAEPVLQVDERIAQLADDMLETMYDANGVGLAAIQVNVQERVIVVDVSQTRDEPLVLINPQIVEHSNTLILHEEGCLSVPDIYDDVERWDWVAVEALDKQGKSFRVEADGLLAVCLQHEIDHLDGHVFVEYLSTLKRNRIRTKLLKRAREQGKQR